MTIDLSELWPVAWHLATGKPWPPPDNDGVDAFYAFAERQKLFPLLMAAEDLPAPIARAKARHRAISALYRKRYQLSCDAVTELHRVLDRDMFLLFKGADFRHRIYPTPDLRPMADIDILLPEDRYARAITQLQDLGYERRYAGRGGAYSPDHHEASIMLGSAHVELHRSFAQPVRNAIDYVAIWNRRETFAADGLSASRPSHNDAVLAQAYELAKDEFSSDLVRYVDFLLLLRHPTTNLDQCVAQARDWQIERPLFGALTLTLALFPSASEPRFTAAMDALLDTRTRRFLKENVLPDPANEPANHVTGRSHQLWRKYRLIDTPWRRIAFVGHHLYQEAKGFYIQYQRPRRP